MRNIYFVIKGDYIEYYVDGKCITDCFSKTEETIHKNLKEINNKYPSVSLEDAKIISSYTCESKEKNFSPYKILNKNLVSDNRKEGSKMFQNIFLFCWNHWGN